MSKRSSLDYRDEYDTAIGAIILDGMMIPVLRMVDFATNWPGYGILLTVYVWSFAIVPVALRLVLR